MKITNAAASVAGSTEITLAAGDAAIGDTIRVSYKRRIVGGTRIQVRTDSTTAKGALYAKWPVYSGGTDCTESSVKG